MQRKTPFSKQKKLELYCFFFFLRKIPARSSTIGILEIRYLPCSACGGDERFARRETISVLAGVDSLVFSEKEEFVDTCSKTSAEDRSKP